MMAQTERLATLIRIIVICLIVIGLGVTIFLTTNNTNQRFRQVTYVNATKTTYRLDFYKDYSTKKLASGNSQLAAKHGLDGKFPLEISIASGKPTSYENLKNCTGLTKVIAVSNDHINQTINICDQLKSQGAEGVLYIAGFMNGGQEHVITITQDYGTVNSQDKAAVTAARAKLGLAPYRQDIQRIVGSISIQK